MYKAPKQGDPATIKTQGKEWNWCKHHKKWVVIYTKRFGEHTSDTSLLNPKNKVKKAKKSDKKRVQIDANAVQDDSDGVPTNSDSSDDESSGDESSDNES